MSDYAPYVLALERAERRIFELEREIRELKCQHDWQEQRGVYERTATIIEEAFHDGTV